MNKIPNKFCRYLEEIIEFYGDNPKREGLKDTPRRVLEMWQTMLKGYNFGDDNSIEKINTTFEGETYDGMIILKDIEIYSICEHHMLPFFGKCHIAYIPNENSRELIGVSKLARIMEVFAKRLQIQERLTDQIADFIIKIIHPLGVAVKIEAEHLCMRMRGVEKQNSKMVTCALRGVFLKEDSTRLEFYNQIR